MTRLFVLGTATLALSTSVLAGSHSTPTKDVVMNHLRAFGALDVDALVATYSDDAEIVTADRVYTGSKEIREFFEPLLAEFSLPDISMETETIVFGEKTGVVVWRAESPENSYEYASDTFFVEGGKIVGHSLAAKVTPK